MLIRISLQGKEMKHRFHIITSGRRPAPRIRFLFPEGA